MQDENYAAGTAVHPQVSFSKSIDSKNAPPVSAPRRARIFTLYDLTTPPSFPPACPICSFPATAVSESKKTAVANLIAMNSYNGATE